MIALMKHILAVSGKYEGRVQLAFISSFLKVLLSKVPVGLSFFALAAFYNGTTSADMCLWIGTVMIAYLPLQILFQHIADRLQSAAGLMMFVDKRMELGAHLRKIPMGYFTESNIGKTNSMLSTDMVLIEENRMTVLADMMNHIFAQGIVLASIMLFNVWLGLASIVVALLLLLVAKKMKKKSLEDSSTRQEQSENLTESVLDFTEGTGIIRTYNLLGEKSKELSDNFREDCRVSIQLEENHPPWQRWLNILYGFGAVVAIAISMYLNSYAPLDVAFLVGIMLFASDPFGPLKALYSQSARLTVVNSCMDRIETVFAESELPDDRKDTTPESGDIPEIQFKNIGFAYEDKEVLYNISFNLKRNSMLALVGPSGGGKSMIAGLLTCSWDVKPGQVLVCGRDVREVELSSLMDHIGMVFQRVHLFQDTIYDNISMGRPSANETGVIEAVRKARCCDFIMVLPDGFQTVAGEGGETLSGGERQRISIARCTLKDAPIVILDEVTANADAGNENYTQQAISELCKGKTLLVIVHRLNTIRGTDKILVIVNGQITQEGTHDGLMSIGGIYKNFTTVRENNHGWSRRETRKV